MDQMQTRTQLISQWSTAASSGTLLTPKHDPNGSVEPVKSYRSILTHHMSASLAAFVQQGHFKIRHYSDRKYPAGDGFYEVVPPPDSSYSIVGEGLLSGSATPTGSLNRLVFVSGSQQGWHVYAESGESIETFVCDGRLSFVRSI